jgi:hypothetical protein
MTDGDREGAADYLVTAAQRTLLDVTYGRPGGEALAPLTQALARHPLQSLDPLDRPYEWLTFAFARAGRVDEARRLLRENENAVPEGMRRTSALRWWGIGALAEAEHRDADALAAWRNAYEETGSCGLCGLYEIAAAQDRLGQPDSALAAYQRIAARPSLESATRLERYTLAPTYKRLGELYEARQDRRKAADYYGRFVDLYQHADPELQPGVREVRERLARLAQEPSS